MDWLTRPLPDTVEIAGQHVKIRTGWRRAVRSYILQSSNEDGLNLTDATALLTSWFARDGQMPQIVRDNPYMALSAAYDWRDSAFGQAMPYGDGSSDNTSKKTFDWEADSGIVRIDFKHIYGIDTSVYQAHWYEFALLFSGICAMDTLTSNAMQARRPLPSDAADYERKQHRALERAWSLPLTEYERVKMHNARILEEW